MAMIISRDHKKALDDLVRSTRRTLEKDQVYLTRFVAELDRAEGKHQRQATGGSPEVGAVYEVHFPRSTCAHQQSTGAEEKLIMETRGRSMLISDADLGNLRQLLTVAKRFLRRNHRHLEALEADLQRALVVTRDQMPRDVITIHTRVRVHELDVGRQCIYTLVFPGEADVARSRISVLAPIGAALLGRRVGDLIECAAPSVTKRLKVREIVSQPENSQRPA